MGNLYYFLIKLTLSPAKAERQGMPFLRPRKGRGWTLITGSNNVSARGKAGRRVKS